jgi:hypothetical protein
MKVNTTEKEIKTKQVTKSYNFHMQLISVLFFRAEIMLFKSYDAYMFTYSHIVRKTWLVENIERQTSYVYVLDIVFCPFNLFPLAIV